MRDEVRKKVELLIERLDALDDLDTGDDFFFKQMADDLRGLIKLDDEKEND